MTESKHQFRTIVLLRSTAVALSVSLFGCGGESESPGGETDQAASQPATDAPPASETPRARRNSDGTISILGLRVQVPRIWQWQETITATRSANFAIPGEGDQEQAEFVVVAFPAGLGGSVTDNVERYRRQFLKPDVQEYPDAIVERLDVNGLIVTTVDLAGRHARPGLNWYANDQRMLAALIEGPEGLVVLRANGVASTMDAASAAFHRMVDRIEVEDSSGSESGE